MVSEALHRVLLRVESDVGPVGGQVEELPGTAPGYRLLLDIARVGRVFLKASDGSEEADEAVACEVALLQALEHRSLPRLLAGDALDEVPWMVQAPLRPSGWVPPWPSRMRHVWSAIDSVSALPPPAWLTALEDIDPWVDLITTEEVGGHAAALQAAAGRVSLQGTSLVHGDLGGSNIHVQGRRVTIVDWSDAVVGNADLDRASVCVDIAHTDGRRVDPPMSDPGAWMAKTAGLLLAAAARPAWHGPGGIEVRRAQAGLARTALDWAIELL